MDKTVKKTDRILFTLILVVMIFVTPAPTRAAILPPGSTVAGRTIAQWHGEQSNWLDSFTSTANAPNHDTTGANANNSQDADVFFFAGSALGPVSRSFVAPNDKPWLIPLVDVAFIRSAGEDLTALRQLVESIINATDDLFFTIDGVSTPMNELLTHREASFYTSVIPPGSLTGEPPGTYPGSFVDGYALMLAPLDPGEYDLRYGGLILNAPFIGTVRFETTATVTVLDPFALAPSAIYNVDDTNSDGVFDDLGDSTVDRSTAVRTAIGEVDTATNNRVRRLVTKFSLPDVPVDKPVLESATLRFFLEDILGTPAGPLSLLHGVTDNDLDPVASDYENPSYVDTLLDLVQPTDPGGRFYELDVTDLVLADYAADGLDPLSAFRFQVNGAIFLEDNQQNSYRLEMPGLGTNPPNLVLTFVVPEPSSIALAFLALLGLLAQGYRRRRA